MGVPSREGLRNNFDAIKGLSGKRKRSGRERSEVGWQKRESTKQARGDGGEKKYEVKNMKDDVA